VTNETGGTPEQARAAVQAHVRLWNARDKASWLELFADDVAYEDPPGTVAARGRGVMSTQAWDASFTETKTWRLEPLLVIACGREAQVHMRNHGSVRGVPVWLDSLELWRVDDEGRVDSVRAFWEIPAEIAQDLGATHWEGERSLTA